MKKKYYKQALYRAAEEAYQDQVIDTEMYDNLIGEGKEFESKEQWIEEKVQMWIYPTEVDTMPEES